MTNSSDLFYSNLPAGIQGETDVEKLLLREYGSVFLARGGAVPPSKIVFADQFDVLGFQEGVEIDKVELGGLEMELQAAAAEALDMSAKDAASAGVSISPRGPDSARRDYNGTVTLWTSRVEPALEHWLAQKELTASEVDWIRSLTPFEQVPAILSLESRGLWFAKDLTKSIIYSVAPPGTSQHLSMLAFDVNEFADPQVRSILARNGWFQTVISDLPHFTFIGAGEKTLPELGLKRIESGDQVFWVPDI